MRRSPLPLQFCREFARSGHCRFGKRCHFVHDRSVHMKGGASMEVEKGGVARREADFSVCVLPAWLPGSSTSVGRGRGDSIGEPKEEKNIRGPL